MSHVGADELIAGSFQAQLRPLRITRCRWPSMPRLCQNSLTRYASVFFSSRHWIKKDEPQVYRSVLWFGCFYIPSYVWAK